MQRRIAGPHAFACGQPQTDVGLHFRRQDAVKRQIGQWPGAALQRAVARLQTGVLESRRSAVGEAVASRTLFEIAAAARASRS